MPSSYSRKFLLVLYAFLKENEMLLLYICPPRYQKLLHFTVSSFQVKISFWRISLDLWMLKQGKNIPRHRTTEYGFARTHACSKSCGFTHTYVIYICHLCHSLTSRYNVSYCKESCYPLLCCQG
jgi:hypothetical protein